MELWKVWKYFSERQWKYIIHLYYVYKFHVYNKFHVQFIFKHFYFLVHSGKESVHYASTEIVTEGV